MEQSLISVALCTYNGELFLAQQLQSIIEQTYQNLEIIIVDDASTDGTLDIIKTYAEKDERIKWFQNNTNKGLNKNFERALRFCSGQYISLSDQDDIWEPQKIQRLADSIGDNWVVFSNSALVNADGKPIGRNLLNSFSYDDKDYRGIVLMNFVTGHTCLIARDFLSQALPVPENTLYDWWFGFVALYHHKLVYLDEILTQYRIHPASYIQRIVAMPDIERIKWQGHTDHLVAFLNYNEIKLADAVFIHELVTGFINKADEDDAPTPFIKLLTQNYQVLFPCEKPREEAEIVEFSTAYASKVKL